jgi:hypothetical protein
VININCIYEFNVWDGEKQLLINLSCGRTYDQSPDYFGYKTYDIENKRGYGEGRYKNPKLNFVKFLREHD